MLEELLKELDLKKLRDNLDEMHSYDIASAFLSLSEDDQDRLIKNITNEKLAEVISYLDNDDAAILLQELDNKKIKEVVENLEPDDAADILLELEEEHQDDILELLDEEVSEQVEALLGYDEDETGAHMTSNLITLSIEDEVKQATKKVIKEASEVESINTLFIVDEDQKYIGTISLKRLLTTKSPAYVKDLYEITPSAIDKNNIEETVNDIRDYGIYEMPVVDASGVLLGMITLDDALDVHHEKSLEDYEKLAMLPDSDIERTVIKTAFHRLPWLLILLSLTIPIAFVTSSFEALLAQMVILMVFQPLILDASGDVATQTLAVVLQLITNNSKEIKKNAAKEIVTGIMNGFFIGLIAALASFIMANINSSLVTKVSPLEMGLIIGLSLWMSVILSSVIALTVPLVLKKAKADPAVASGPFITAIIDVLSLLIYLGLASFMVGGTLL